MMNLLRHAQTARSERGAGSALVAGVVVAFAAVLLAVVWLPASAAHAAAAAVSPAQPDSSLSAMDNAPMPARLRAAGAVGDWDHGLQVVAWLRHRLPPRRVVYLFGGSAARESVISESIWTAQLRAVSGKPVAAYVLASRCQTYVEDLALVNQLPKGRGVVLLNVGTTRFTMMHPSKPVPKHGTRSRPPGPWYQHHYDVTRGFSLAGQRTLVREWVRDRYGVFLSRYPDRLLELETLVKACLARGLRPVLLEMPLNLPVIGKAFDDARSLYQRGCLKLANQNDIPYVRFVTRIGLRASDFYDLQHMLLSGRTKWQARLSHELVWRKLL